MASDFNINRILSWIFDKMLLSNFFLFSNA